MTFRRARWLVIAAVAVFTAMSLETAAATGEWTGLFWTVGQMGLVAFVTWRVLAEGETS